MKTSMSNNFDAFHMFLNEITDKVNHWFRHFVGQDYIIEPVLVEPFDCLPPVVRIIRNSMKSLLTRLRDDASELPDYRYFLFKSFVGHKFLHID
jgi:hypothetical protein